MGRPAPGVADSSRGVRHRRRRNRVLRLLILRGLVQGKRRGECGYGIGSVVHHVWCTEKPATSMRGGAGGASRWTHAK